MNENAQYAYRYLQEKHKLTPAQAAGVVGNLMQESSLDTGARNKGDGTDGSDSVGIAQWNGTRARALREFAGDNVSNLDTQLDFMMHELQTKETGAWKQLQNADDVHSATAAFIGYERPQGYSQKNPMNGHGWKNRLEFANTIAGTSPEQIAAAKVTPGTERVEAQAEPRRETVEIRRFVEVPDEIAGVDVQKASTAMTDFAKLAQAHADRQNANVSRGGLLRSSQEVVPNANATYQAVPLFVPPIGAAAELEKKKRLMALLGTTGGIGGLGGLGNYV